MAAGGLGRVGGRVDVVVDVDVAVVVVKG